MKVSVIIPLYNAQAYVERAIASALAQPEVVECIVVDDGSSDEGLKISKSIAATDRRVLVFQHKNGRNLGASISRNRGMMEANGDYIAFLDADDYYLEHRFKETAQVFKKHGDAAGVYEGLATEAWDGSVPDKHFTMITEQVCPEDLFLAAAPFGKCGHISLVGLTIKFKAIKMAGAFNPKLRLAQDTEWLAKLALTCRLYPGILDAAVAIRTVHPGNSTNNKELLRSQRVEMCFSLLQYAVDQKHGQQIREAICNVLVKYYFDNNLHSPRSKLHVKAGDLLFLARMRMIDSTVFGFPRVDYFMRLVLRLPISQEFNFYQ